MTTNRPAVEPGASVCIGACLLGLWMRNPLQARLRCLLRPSPAAAVLPPGSQSARLRTACRIEKSSSCDVQVNLCGCRLNPGGPTGRLWQGAQQG